MYVCMYVCMYSPYKLESQKTRKLENENQKTRQQKTEKLENWKTG